MYPTQSEQITRLVAQVMSVESITWGNPGNNPRQGYLARYQGQLLSEDSASCYETLAAALRPLNITPLFRNEDDKHTILLVNGVTNPSPSNVWVNVVLFVLTVISVLISGILYNYEGPVSSNAGVMLRALVNNLGSGVAFAVSLLSILLAHEFGHYLMARYHKTAATLPYFVPFPFSPFGTMGAVIFQKESHRNKRILLDIGLAGPLAGLVVAIPVLLIGLSLSNIDTLPRVVPSGDGLSLEGNSILYLLAKFAVFRQWLPEPASFGNLPPLLYWLRYFFTGLPTPLGGRDVMLHPVAWAGWAGLLVTALNLIPAGQLDGGHIIHGLLGRRASALVPFILAASALLGLVWSGWWLWALLIFFLGRTYAEPLDQITQLDPRRKALAVLGLIIFVLVFTPVPLRAVFGS